MPERAFLIFLLFYSEFSCPGRVGTEFGTKIFFSLSQPTHPVWAKNNARKRFLMFRIFLLFFSEFSCPGRVWTEFGTKFFFSLSQPISLFPSFSTSLIPFWIEIIPERGFLIFSFFFYFFRNFLARVECERNSGLKFFFLFLGLSYPRFVEK